MRKGKQEEKEAKKAAKKAAKAHDKTMKQAIAEGKKADIALKSEQLRVASQETRHDAEDKRRQHEQHAKVAVENRERAAGLFKTINLQLQRLNKRRKAGKVGLTWTNRDDVQAVNKAYTRICYNCLKLIGIGAYFRKL